MRQSAPHSYQTGVPPWALQSESENSASEGRSMARSFAHFDSRLFIQFSVLVLTAIISFFLGRFWSNGHSQLVFFSGTGDGDAAARFALPPISVTFSPNLTFDASGLTSNAALLLDAAPPPLDVYPPPAWQREVGIVDGNGTMRVDFDAEDFDPDVASGWDDGGLGNNETVAKASEEGERVATVKIDRFKVCPESAKDWIPCMDSSKEAIEGFHSTQIGERYERHCPPPGKGLDCLVPAPKDYKKPIPWPQSRDEVWFSNLPHTRLVEDKGGQIWISRDKKKFKFHGDVTQFIHGATEYLDQISRMVPDIAFGSRTRVVLDVGSGVASFGAFLLSRNVITMSTAPKDVHENQIQFVLERGVPAMVAALATHRLPYPSRAFDLIHCSRCRINWTRDDGILLLEVNRLLRAGGYFVWAAQPVYKHEEIQQEAWKDMEDLTARICWELVKKEGYIAIWQKPLNNLCYIGRSSGVQPLLCDTEDQPDAVRYVNLKACITRLPENGYDGNVPSWPARLHEPPQRLQEFGMDAFLAKNELFRTESDYWNEIVERHIRIFHWKKMRPRNVMDMRAGFGGYAAALINQQIDCWVMNVVPVSGPNTLPVIYDRGLIGVNHDWCEPFDTYPRTYDLLHASSLFSQERKRCNISGILLEMDRILRPGGNVYIRDSKYIMDDILEITRALGWRTNLRATHEGPYANRKLLVCQKLVP